MPESGHIRTGMVIIEIWLQMWMRVIVDVDVYVGFSLQL
jgi:hypothetical protein